MASRAAGAVGGFRCGAGSDTDPSLGRVDSSPPLCSLGMSHTAWTRRGRAWFAW
ncbi:hypothetical protein BDA96_06G092500 [Sorghum bicolor]|uniref:Uncharacterized protein n=1 Tax=Sorghum bicolor TaxID=4558 RepID=A0A921QRL9_SORBI|nr:hypothetical protein BDA96_06G092500 [Sorghum bicolor]